MAITDLIARNNWLRLQFSRQYYMVTINNLAYCWESYLSNIYDSNSYEKQHPHKPNNHSFALTACIPHRHKNSSTMLARRSSWKRMQCISVLGLWQLSHRHNYFMYCGTCIRACRDWSCVVLIIVLLAVVLFYFLITLRRNNFKTYCCVIIMSF